MATPTKLSSARTPASARALTSARTVTSTRALTSARAPVEKRYQLQITNLTEGRRARYVFNSLDEVRAAMLDEDGLFMTWFYGDDTDWVDRVQAIPEEELLEQFFLAFQELEIEDVMHLFFLVGPLTDQIVESSQAGELRENPPANWILGWN